MQFSAPRAVAHKVGTQWVLEAEGGARGQNSAGQIRAPRVLWDEAKNRVTASGGVTLNKAGAVLQGQALSGDTRFQNAILSGQVRGQLADGTIITAQQLEKRGELLLAQSGATARLKPRGALGALTLRGARIEAPSDGSSARASGGVTISSSTGATAKAPRATYNRAQSLVTASGGVDFFDPVRKLRTHGDTLIYNLKTNEAKLSYSTGQSSLDLFGGKNCFEIRCKFRATRPSPVSPRLAILSRKREKDFHGVNAMNARQPNRKLQSLLNPSPACGRGWRASARRVRAALRGTCTQQSPFIH